MKNWKHSERDLGYCIIEMLLDKDIDDQEFTAADIERSGKIQLLSPNSIGQSITPLLRSLKLNHRELTQSKGEYNPYKLRDGYLSMILSLRRRYNRNIKYEDNVIENIDNLSIKSVYAYLGKYYSKIKNFLVYIINIPRF